MNESLTTNFLEIWYSAANAEFGVVFETNNPTSVKQQLLQARKAADDPIINNLIIRPSPVNPNHLWILKPYKGKEPNSSNLQEIDIEI